jgi:phosphoglycolate phosphatase
LPTVLVVGFDLDMTLVDSRAGTVATLHALSAATGVEIDAPLVASRLGVPFEVEMANWAHEDRIPELADRFRALFPRHGLPLVQAMPGAHAAVAAVDRALVVTARFEPNARMIIEQCALPIDDVFGWKHGPAKGDALRDASARVYVGDTVGDVRGAHAAGAVAVAVPTGHDTAAELDAAGADVVLTSLTEFPEWLAAWRSSLRGDGAGGSASPPRQGAPPPAPRARRRR